VEKKYFHIRVSSFQGLCLVEFGFEEPSVVQQQENGDFAISFLNQFVGGCTQLSYFQGKVEGRPRPPQRKTKPKCGSIALDLNSI
jgi:hypothetical protein